MHYPFNIVNKKLDKFLLPVNKLLHEVGINPNYITLLSFILSLIAAMFFFFQNWTLAFIFLILSLLLDVLDGSIARTCHLVSKRGETLDTICDRTSEFVIFLAFVLNGSVSMLLFILAYYAIILNTLLRKKAKIDFGFKRATLFLVFIFSFNIVFTLIFAVNLISFVVQLLVLDYKTDKDYFFKENGIK